MSIAERVHTEPLAIPRPAVTAPFPHIDTFDKTCPRFIENGQAP